MSGPHPLLRYTTARMALFVVSCAVLWLLGARGLLLLALAVVVSGLASVTLLSRQRDAVSVVISARVQRVRDRIDVASRSEDDD